MTAQSSLDASQAKSLIEGIVPREGLRRPLLEAVAEVIVAAHEANPASWTLRLPTHGRLLRCNVGQWYVIHFYADRLGVFLHDEALDSELIERLKQSAQTPSETSARLSSCSWYQFTLEEGVELLPQMREALISACSKAARAMARTNLYRAHTPEAVQALREMLNRDLPDPDYGELPEEADGPVDRVLRHIRSVYPDWEGFDHPGFQRDEVEYKRKAAEVAREKLAERRLRRLLEAENYEEIRGSLLAVANASVNLLYKSVPIEGDLYLLHRDDVRLDVLSDRMVHLLWGEGSTPQRLDDFFRFCTDAGLPLKWTFPTHYLFLCHPGREIFIKPQVVARFLRLIGQQDVYDATPSGGAYEQMRATLVELGEEFDPPPQDMIELQSLVFVAGSSYQSTKYWKVAPGEGAWMWEECQRGGFIALGWDEMGDLSGLTKKEFNQRCEEALKNHPDWTKTQLEQLWRFYRRVSEGDKIVANRGTSAVVGLGTVTGPYEFHEDKEMSHRRAVAWEDVQSRNVEEPGWRRTLIELDKEQYEGIANSPSSRASGVSEKRSTGRVQNPAIPERGFELLDGLHENPTKEYYSAHKEEMREHLLDPFKAFVQDVARLLPEPIRSALETEKDIFSRIPKNDFGRGGAWDHIWSAFHEPDVRRIQGAQLYCWLNGEVFDCGFALGDYTSEVGNRLLSNLQEHRSLLESQWKTVAEGMELHMGSSREAGSRLELPAFKWEAWISAEDAKELTLHRLFDREEVLSRPRAELAEEIAGLFQALHPIYLMATRENPSGELASILGGEEEPERKDPYPLDRIAEETGFERDMLERWVAAIERKGQAILYGPPGTGKTYLAELLARHLIGGGEGETDLIQFHPAYAYEDFVQGIRPKSVDGVVTYPVRDGRLKEFCEGIRGREGRSVLIIDEINRANLSRVFGELMYLLEYRDRRIPLAGGGTFSLPKNLRILGTMNTADRSIALVDHALRRRFAFLRMQPNYEVLRHYHESRETGFEVAGLIDCLKQVNETIADPHYEVGVSFFLDERLADRIEDIWRMEIEPYLEEYFFDQQAKLDDLRWNRVASRILGG